VVVIEANSSDEAIVGLEVLDELNKGKDLFPELDVAVE
jgi:hypothetical protein